MALSGDKTMQGPGQAEIPKNARFGAAGTVAPCFRGGTIFVIAGGMSVLVL